MTAGKVVSLYRTKAPPVPVDLARVAWSFILIGLTDLALSFAKWQGGNAEISLETGSIFLGLGLLRFSGWWRGLAILGAGAALLGAGIEILGAISGEFAENKTLFGMDVAEIGVPLYVLALFCSFAISFWQLSILLRKDIRKAFAEAL